MKFALLDCLLFSSITALCAPINHGRNDDDFVADDDFSAENDLAADVVTVTTTITPTPASAPSQALLNAVGAQNFNAIFRNLQSSDTCTDGSFACVTGAVAQCVGGRWAGTPCSGSNQCFVVPGDPSKPDTQLGCMSEQTAANLIADAGAKGGVFGDEF